MHVIYCLVSEGASLVLLYRNVAINVTNSIYGLLEITGLNIELYLLKKKMFMSEYVQFE